MKRPDSSCVNHGLPPLQVCGKHGVQASLDVGFGWFIFVSPSRTAQLDACDYSYGALYALINTT